MFYEGVVFYEKECFWDLGLIILVRNLDEVEGIEDRFLIKGIKDCTTFVIRGLYFGFVCI